MNEQPRTRTAPAERRGGTYEADDEVTALLRYGTHTIHDLPRGRKLTTMGSAPDRDIVIHGEYVSAHHCRLERKTRTVLVTDDASKNGTYYEVKRTLGHALTPSFEEARAPEEGFTLAPGQTFVVGAEPHRFIALDDAMRAHHSTLADIVGREDEVRGSTELGETASPSDLILAGDSGGHMLITGKAGCEQETLARIVHAISKRRRRPIVELDCIPDDRKAQSALVKRDATKATLVLHLGENEDRIDPSFVPSLFSPSYHIRVIVTARTMNVARRALGMEYVRPVSVKIVAA